MRQVPLLITPLAKQIKPAHTHTHTQAQTEKVNKWTSCKKNKKVQLHLNTSSKWTLGVLLLSDQLYGDYSMYWFPWLHKFI